MKCGICEIGCHITENCKGIAFCINDPAVSFFSFLKLARLAQKKNLLVGFSTNGYFTRLALEALIPFTDFVNVGFKGFTEEAYQACGVHSSEPTIRESEALCARLQTRLDHVYLFNSPGSDLLNTLCPDCGNTLITREFFGPMGSRIVDHQPDARCTCGSRPAIKGDIAKIRYDEHGFFGGYQTTRAFEMLHAVLVCIGADNPEKLSQLWFDLIETNYLKEFHETVRLPEQAVDAERQTGRHHYPDGIDGHEPGYYFYFRVFVLPGVRFL